MLKHSLAKSNYLPFPCSPCKYEEISPRLLEDYASSQIKVKWLSLKITIIQTIVIKYLGVQFSSVQFSSVTQSCPTLCTPINHSTSRSPCPSPTPRVYSNSCPLSQWCHPTISFSVVPLSSCPQPLPASRSFPVSQLGQLIQRKIIFNLLPCDGYISPLIQYIEVD